MGGRAERVKRVRMVGRCIISILLMEGGSLGYSADSGDDGKEGGEKGSYAAVCWYRVGMGYGCVI